MDARHGMTRGPRRFRWRAAVGIAAALLMSAVGSVGAAAVEVAPNGGPVAGGTRVTITGGEIAVGAASIGERQMLLRLSDGTLWGVGNSTVGELGLGSGVNFAPDPMPVPLPAGVSVASVTSGQRAGYLVTSEGALYSTGYNGYGELGTGDFAQLSEFTPAALPAGVTVASVHPMHYAVLVLDPTGGVYGAGANFDGRLAATAPSYNPTFVPADMPDGVRFTALDTGDDHAIALDANGVVYTWGDNAAGQLGDGTTTDSGQIRPVEGLPTDSAVVGVAAGHRHSAVLLADGRVYAWGANASYELGNGTTSGPALSPVPVTGLPPIVRLQAAGTRTVAVDVDGTGWIWGGGWGDAALVAAPDSAGVVQGDSAGRVFVPSRLLVPGDAALDTLVLAPTSLVVRTAAGDWLGTSDYNQTAHIGNGTEQLFPIPLEPTLALAPDSADFGGVRGSDPTVTGPRTLSVVTPAHPEGPVDVRLHWIWNRDAAATGPVETLAQGFVYAAVPQIVTPTVPGAVLGQPYQAVVQADGTGPLRFEVVDGELPAGLLLDPDTGTITGTPSAAGVTSFLIRVTGPGGSDEQRYTVQVAVAPSWVTQDLPEGTVGDPYRTALVAEGDPMIGYSVLDGAWPPGISLDPETGQLAGTPSAAGSFTVQVRAANDSGTADRTFVLRVGTAPSITTTALPGGTAGVAYRAALTADGDGPLRWSAEGLPAGLTLDASTGEVTGSPVSDGTFTVRVSVDNDHGTDAREFTLVVVASPVIPDPGDGSGGSSADAGSSGSAGSPGAAASPGASGTAAGSPGLAGLPITGSVHASTQAIAALGLIVAGGLLSVAAFRGRLRQRRH